MDVTYDSSVIRTNQVISIQFTLSVLINFLQTTTLPYSVVIYSCRPRVRFTCPRQLTTPWPTRRPRRLTNVAAESPVCTGLPRRGRFTRERLQLHLAIVNFMADYFRPGTSGDIHLKYILLVHIIFYQRAVYLCLGLQYC